MKLVAKPGWAGAALLVVFGTIAPGPPLSGQLRYSKVTVIGRSEAAPLTTVSDALLHGNRLYVGQPDDKTVAVFKIDGAPEGVIGGPGVGPGEFQYPARLAILRDTLWVADWRQLRLTSFYDGKYVRGEPVRSVAGQVYVPVSVTRDGRALIVPTPPPPVDPSTERRSLIPLLALRSGASADTLAWLEAVSAPMPLRNPAQPTHRTLALQQPLVLKDYWSTQQDGSALVIAHPKVEGASATIQLAWMSLQGDTLLKRSFRIQTKPVSARMKEALISRYASLLLKQRMVASDRVARQVASDAIRFPPILPPITDFIVGDDRTLWIRREEAPDAEVVTYDVFSEDGTLLDHITIPRSGRLLRASRTYLLHTQLGDNDEQLLVLKQSQ